MSDVADNVNLIDDDISLRDKMLTTMDNPHNPKTDYDKWKQFDMDNNYNTEEYIARIADVPSEVELNNEPIIEKLRTKAIYEILEHDLLGIYKLV